MPATVDGLPVNNADPKFLNRFGSTLVSYFDSLGFEVHASGGGFWGINRKVDDSGLEVFIINDKDQLGHDGSLAWLCINSQGAMQQSLSRGRFHRTFTNS